MTPAAYRFARRAVAPLLACALLACEPRVAQRGDRAPQGAAAATIIAVPSASARASAPSLAPAASPASPILLRLTIHPDPGYPAIPLPAVVETPSGDLVVAGTSYEADLGKGAEHVADGFVAGFAPDGTRRWLCLAKSPPAELRGDDAGRLHVALSEPGASACAPGVGGPRAGGRWGSVGTDTYWSNVHVALDEHGAPRWSLPKSSVGIDGPLRATVGGAGGGVLLFGLARDRWTLVAVDDTGHVRWSRRAPKLETSGPHDLPDIAMSSTGTSAVYTGMFTGSNGDRASMLPARSLVRLDASGYITWVDALQAADGRAFDGSPVIHGLELDGEDVLLLGSAARPISLGGQLVPCAAAGSAFLARLDATGKAKWVRVLERGAGLDADGHAQLELLRGRDGGVVIVGRSFGPPPEQGERDLEISLRRLDRDGRDAARRTLSLRGIAEPHFAASAAGNSVLVIASVRSAAQAEQLFPGASIAIPPAGVAVVVARLGL